MTTDTLTITAFILDRVEATEREANYLRNVGVRGPQYGSVNGALSHVIDDILATCKALRAIVELHKSWPVLVEGPPTFETGAPNDTNSMTIRASRQIQWLTEQQYRNRFGSEPPTAPMLKALAAIYAGEPGFQEEWAL